MTHRLIQAARRQAVDRSPVWIMRQAGRYLPEFRAIRANMDFLTRCKTPAIAAELTLQPISRIGVDAAIIFSDILIPVEPMGQELTFSDAKGPVLPNPIRTLAQVEALRVPSADETVPFLGEAIRLVKRELDGKLPVIGFCGAPWTIAAYMIEGAGSRNYAWIKRMMYNEPQAFHMLMDKLTETLIDYLKHQITAGADIVQIFESWGGALSRADYLIYELPYVKRIIEGIKDTGVPIVLYMNGGGHVLDDLADSGADVLGIDWKVDLKDAFDRVGHKVALQGNMDPCMLYASPERIAQEVKAMVAAVGDRPGHIFNLGHGILPDMDPDHAKAFVDAVKTYSVKQYA